MRSKSNQDATLDAATLDPLPPVLQRGLVAVFLLVFLSFISSSALLFHLAHKLIKRRLHCQACKGYHQFLLLLYNLLVTDIKQSLAFLLTVSWLAEDRTDTRSSTCFAEGGFVSTGDLASGVWIFAMASHTIFVVVKGKRLPYSIFLSAIAVLWIFIVVMTVVGVVSHRETFYVQGGARRWIDEQCAFELFWLHSFWIFLTMCGTIRLCMTIFSALNIHLRLESTALASSLTSLSCRLSAPGPRTINHAARHLIMCLTTYVLCKLSFAAGRMAAMTGHATPYWYYCVTLATIMSCGWLDVLRYTFTRHVLVFSDTPPAINECGIEIFGIRYSQDELWSVRTVVEGGLLVDQTVSTRRRKQHKKHTSRNESSQCQDGIMDDTFDIATPGVITTKTTITVTTEPRMVFWKKVRAMSLGLLLSLVTKLRHTASERSMANSTMGPRGWPGL